MAADLETWSYYIHEVQIDDLKERKGLTAAFKTLGDDGWELVSSSSAIRPPQQFGNPIVFVFKKRGSGHKPGVLDPDAPTLKLHRATSVLQARAQRVAYARFNSSHRVPAW